MSTPPLVSVVVAVKNGARYLAQALESVCAQTYPHYEIVVVDGRSTDRSVEIARSFPNVRVLEQTGKGFADAWNVGIEHAQGELIGLLDSDDRWAPDKLSEQTALFGREPEIEYCITRMEFFLEREGFIPPGFNPQLLEGAHDAYFPGATLVRRPLYERIGTFQTHWEIASDVEWFKRAKDRGARLGIVPKVLYYKRVHDANLSYYAARNYNREVVTLLKQSLDRKRARRQNETPD